MNIKPLGQRIIAEIINEPAKTQGGIIIPDTVEQQNQKALVIKISDEVLNDPKNQIKQGDNILISKFAGQKFTLNAKEILIIETNDILAII